MKVVETVAELQALSRQWRSDGESVGFVPTMGALHEGHLSLVRASKAADDRVIVSIFVNPTQFNERADFRSYPRDFDTDLALLQPLHVDAIFHPSAEEMYPAGMAATIVHAGAVAKRLEGAQRPGHFDGVATVVARLLNAAMPDRAYFGQKDAQQLQVVRALVRDLGFPVEVVACPTVRESDGLAMSSRNQRLSVEHRRDAVALVHLLAAAQAAFAEGEHDALEIARRASTEVLPGGVVEYAEVVHTPTFERRAVAKGEDLFVVAARIGEVRLIDNAVIGAGDLIQFRARRLQEVH